MLLIVLKNSHSSFKHALLRKSHKISKIGHNTTIVVRLLLCTVWSIVLKGAFRHAPFLVHEQFA